MLVTVPALPTISINNFLMEIFLIPKDSLVDVCDSMRTYKE